MTKKNERDRKGLSEKTFSSDIEDVFGPSMLEKLYFVLLAMTHRYKDINDMKLQGSRSYIDILDEHWDQAYNVFHFGPWQFSENREGYKCPVVNVCRWLDPSVTGQTSINWMKDLPKWRIDFFEQGCRLHDYQQSMLSKGCPSKNYRGHFASQSDSTTPDPLDLTIDGDSSNNFYYHQGRRNLEENIQRIKASRLRGSGGEHEIASGRSSQKYRNASYSPGSGDSVVGSSLVYKAKVSQSRSTLWGNSGVKKERLGSIGQSSGEDAPQPLPRYGRSLSRRPSSISSSTLSMDSPQEDHNMTKTRMFRSLSVNLDEVGQGENKSRLSEKTDSLLDSTDFSENPKVLINPVDEETESFKNSASSVSSVLAGVNTSASKESYVAGMFGSISGIEETTLEKNDCDDQMQSLFNPPSSLRLATDIVADAKSPTLSQSTLSKTIHKKKSQKAKFTALESPKIPHTTNTSRFTHPRETATTQGSIFVESMTSAALVEECSAENSHALSIVEPRALKAMKRSSNSKKSSKTSSSTPMTQRYVNDDGAFNFDTEGKDGLMRDDPEFMHEHLSFITFTRGSSIDENERKTLRKNPNSKQVKPGGRLDEMYMSGTATKNGGNKPNK